MGSHLDPVVTEVQYSKSPFLSSVLVKASVGCAGNRGP